MLATDQSSGWTRNASRLSLTHGQTLWLLNEIGFRKGIDGSTFNYYVKSLRKIGIPFEKNPEPSGYRQATYDFEALMELSLVLLLRGYGSLPDAISKGLRTYRTHLKPMYRKALAAIEDDKQATIHGRAGERCVATGIYLDLNIRYAAGEELRFGPPRILSAFEALKMFSQAAEPARAGVPINLSALAKQLVDKAHDLPEIWRGRAAKHHPSENPFSISARAGAKPPRPKQRKA